VIQNVDNGVVWGSEGSLKVTGNSGNSAIQYSAHEFLLVFQSNYVPILHQHHIGDVARYWLKIANFNLHHLYLAPRMALFA